MKKCLVSLAMFVLICMLFSCSNSLPFGASKTPISESVAKALLEKQYGPNAGVNILGIYAENETKSYIFARISSENNQHDYLALKLSDGRWVLAPKGGLFGGSEIADNIQKGYFIK